MTAWLTLFNPFSQLYKLIKSGLYIYLHLFFFLKTEKLWWLSALPQCFNFVYNHLCGYNVLLWCQQEPALLRHMQDSDKYKYPGKVKKDKTQSEYTKLTYWYRKDKSENKIRTELPLLYPFILKLSVMFYCLQQSIQSEISDGHCFHREYTA